MTATRAAETAEIDSRQAVRRVAGAAGIMAVAILASRLLGLVRNAVISYRFGQGYEADVYTAAFLIPDLLFYLVAGGALSSAFIPVFTEKITHGKEEEASRLFSTVATCMFALVTGVVILGEIFAHPLVRWMNFGFRPDKVADTVALTRVIMPAQICFFLGGLLMGVQYSRGKFFIPAMGPIIYNLGIIFGGWVLAPWMGVSGLVWGALGGAILGNFALQAWAVSRTGLVFSPSLNWRNPDAVKVWKLMIPVVLGLALPQVSILINRMYASALGDGPPAALTNANQLMQVPLGIFAQAMGVAILPTLSALAAQRKFAELRETASAGIRTLLFLTIPASAFLIVLAAPIITLLLQHGRFTAADTQLTADALVFYSIGIFAWSAHAVLSKTFYSLQDTRTPVLIGGFVTLLFIPMNGFLTFKLHLGIKGLALATTIAASLHMCLMILALRRRLGGFEGRTLAASVARTLGASAVAAAVCVAARWGLEGGWIHLPGVKLRALLTVALSLSAGIGAYGLAAKALGMEELQQVLSLLRRRRARAA